MKRTYSQELATKIYYEYTTNFFSTYRSIAKKYQIPLSSLINIIKRESKARGMKSAMVAVKKNRNSAIAKEIKNVQEKMVQLRAERDAVGPKYGLSSRYARALSGKSN